MDNWPPVPHVIQPTDIGATAVKYAEYCPQNITVSPWGGIDSIEPFVSAGRNVTVIGCIPIGHPNVCGQVRATIRSWPFADQLGGILDCDETQNLMEAQIA